MATHIFGARGDSIIFHSFFEKFYDKVFFPYLLENKIDQVYQLGDLFDRRKYINFNSLYLCRKYFFDKIEQNNIKLYTLLGNHDISYKNTLEVNSSQLLLNEYNNVVVYDKPTTVMVDNVPIDIIPWICDDNENEVLEFMKMTKSQICFGHFEIAGFQPQRGVVSDIGIDKKTFSRYDKVLSGHFHLKSDDGQIYYVGTPYEMMWSDYGDIKGFHIFDTETREMEFIPNPLKIFYKLKYDDSLMDFDYWKNYDYQDLRDCYVKIVVLNKQNPYLFDNVIDNLQRVGVADISIVEDFTELTIENDKDIVDQAEDTMTILSKYIDNLTMDVEAEKLKKLMRELYVEAINLERTE